MDPMNITVQTPEYKPWPYCWVTGALTMATQHLLSSRTGAAVVT